MKNTKTALLAVALSASLLAAAGCSSSGGNGSGQSTGDSNSSDSGSTSAAGAMKTQPAAGIPSTYDGTLPMPEQGKLYDNPQPRSQVKDGGELKLPIVEIPPNFNSWNLDGNSIYTKDVDYFTSPQLWSYDYSGTPTPNKDYLLSAKLVSKDPMTVKYDLNPKATWNNGDPITWKAFRTTWITQSGNDPDKYNPAATDGYSSIGDVKKGKDEKEAIVTFKTPFYPYQYVFPQLENPKNLSSDFYKNGWVKDAHNELRAGPYQVAKLTSNQIVLTPNPKWWGDKPKLDKITFTQMEDSASIDAFQNGEIDMTGVDTADRLKRVRSMDDVQIRRGFSLSTAVYIMAKSSKFFEDPQARKAVILGTDRKLLAKIDLKGLDWNEEPPGSELLYPFQDGYTDNMKDLHFDVEMAKKTLDDAGWKMGSDGYRSKNGVKAEFRFVNFGDDPTTNAKARAEQQMMKQIGVKLDIDNHKSADFSTVLTKKDFDMITIGWSAGDPYSYASSICQLYCSDSTSNFSGIGNPKVDAELKKVGSIPDMDKAIAAANKAESDALHLFGTFPLENGPYMVATKAGLANFPGFGYGSGGLTGFKSVPAADVGWQK